MWFTARSSYKIALQSSRFLRKVPLPNVATPNFLWFVKCCDDLSFYTHWKWKTEFILLKRIKHFYFERSKHHKKNKLFNRDGRKKNGEKSKTKGKAKKFCINFSQFCSSSFFISLTKPQSLNVCAACCVLNVFLNKMRKRRLNRKNRRTTTFKTSKTAVFRKCENLHFCKNTFFFAALQKKEAF